MNIAQDLLKELFDYKDGQLIRKVSRRRGKVGDVAGFLNDGGYILIGINGKSHRAHRLIWIYHNGDIDKGLQIDHINGIRVDNRIDNLRLVTNQENAFNTKAKGYSWHKEKRKWHSQITINGKRKHIGYFDTELNAKNAYIEAKNKYHTIHIH